MSTKGMILSDFVIYNEDEEVIAIGSRQECRERLGYTEKAMDTLLSRPIAGWTVVKFKSDKYRCTTYGITDKVSETFVYRRRKVRA